MARERGAFDGAHFGFQGGYDIALTPEWTVGGMAGYSHATGDLKDRSVDIDVNSYMVGAYGAYAQGPLLASAMLSYGLHDADVTRQINFGAIQRTASGDAMNHSVSLGGSLSYSYALPWEGLTLTPTGSALYTALIQEGYSESGAGVFGLTYDGETDHSLTLQAMLALSKLFALQDGGKLVPEARVGVEGTLGNDRTRTARFNGLPNAQMRFGETTGDRSAIAGLFGLGLAYGLPQSQVSLVADYESRLSTDQWSHRLLGGFRVNW